MWKLGSLSLDLKNRHFTIPSKFDGAEDLKVSFPDYGEYHQTKSEASAFCIRFQQQMKLLIKLNSLSESDQEDFEITWTPDVPDVCPTNNVKLADHWYGGPEMVYQRWPFELQYAELQPYVSSDMLSTRDYYKALYGSIIEKYWVSSSGFGIKVDENMPLLISYNEGEEKTMVLKSMALHPRYMAKSSELRYTVCVGKNVKDIHQYMSRKYFERPQCPPDMRMFADPIWSTWARYKEAVNRENVLEYAKEILEHGVPYSQIEIDDMYSSFYGELDFDEVKFPSAKGMIEKLHQDGFRVTVWVHPFVNQDAPCFDEGVQQGYFVYTEDPVTSSRVPALVKWWQGVGALIDMTNSSATEWFINRLEKMRADFGIDSFKFDAGEIGYLPIGGKTKKKLENPSQFTAAYIDVVEKFGGLVEARAATQTQKHGIFVRMMDKDSIWGYNNGLKTMIPTALMMGILGYPFILPDMIGGNAYGDQGVSDLILPEKELYIRWMQLSAFMPSMQFSIAPWQFDEETITIAKEAIKLHKEVAMPVVEEAVHLAVESGMYMLSY